MSNFPTTSYFQPIAKNHGASPSCQSYASSFSIFIQHRTLSNPEFVDPLKVMQHQESTHFGCKDFMCEKSREAHPCCHLPNVLNPNAAPRYVSGTIVEMISASSCGILLLSVCHILTDSCQGII